MAREKFQELEVQAATVEAAISEGLERLKLSENDVIVDIVDEGSKGLLGIGAREAVVILRPKSPAVETPKETQTTKPKPQPQKSEPVVREQPKPKKNRQPRPVTEQDFAGLEKEQEVALGIIEELLEKMAVTADVSASLSEPDDVTGRQINEFEITGEDLGQLVGARGETLEALQYLSRLMVAHKLHNRAYFVIDVDGYRAKREQALAAMAERMAGKVVDRQQQIALEPMSAYERRVIHMTLRDSDEVYTESSGEGKFRKVIIYPKND